MLAVLPATSVDCERGFSNLNRIKSDGRNKLGNDHLEALLRISTVGWNAVTFLQHREVLIARWKRISDRRMSGKGDTLT